MKRPHISKTMRKLILISTRPSAVGAIIGVIFGLDVFTFIGTAYGTLYVIPVLLSLGFLIQRGPIFTATLCTFLVIIGYSLSHASADVVQLGINNRSIAIIVLWVTALLCLHIKRVQERLETTISHLQIAVERVRALEGIIPICGRCKSIRTDEGSWNRIENYIMEHIDAQFSHGLCPSCTEDAMKSIEKLQPARK